MSPSKVHPSSSFFSRLFLTAFVGSIWSLEDIATVHRGEVYERVENVDKRTCYSYRGTYTSTGVCYCPPAYTLTSGNRGRVTCRAPRRTSCVRHTEFERRWRSGCRVLDVMVWDMISLRLEQILSYLPLLSLNSSAPYW